MFLANHLGAENTMDKNGIQYVESFTDYYFVSQ
jgi:hypothetical protein